MSVLSWLMAQYYDRSMQDAETKCLQHWRSMLLSDLEGDVLEIGCGTGINLNYFGDKIKQLILVEPNTHMRQKLQKKILSKKHLNVRILDCTAESIPLENNSCDAVVSTLVLCSVKSQSNVLSELHRILRPGGKLVFIEHIAARDNPKRLRWQKRLEPFWKIISSGCHITRSTEEAIVNAGFTFKEITQQSIRGVPPIVRPSIKGIAIKQ